MNTTPVIKYVQKFNVQRFKVESINFERLNLELLNPDLYSSFLWRTTTVMRHRCDILNAGYLNSVLR